MMVAAILMGIFAIYTLRSELQQIIEYETKMEVLLDEIFANISVFQTQEGTVEVPVKIKDKTKDSLFQKQNHLGLWEL